MTKAEAVPSECRRLSPDPLGGDTSNPQSLNRYAYALNSPVTLTDPSGLESCTIGSDCVIVSDTFPDPTDAVLAEFYLSQLLPGNTFQYVGPPGFKLKPVPPPKPTPPGLQVSTIKLIKSFNQCAANVADKYSVASLLHLNNVPGLGAVLGSSSAAVSHLLLGTRPSEYVPAGTNLAAGVKAGCGS